MAETASGAPEEGARAIPFSVLAERLNAIHETHLLVELRGQKRREDAQLMDASRASSRRDASC